MFELRALEEASDWMKLGYVDVIRESPMIPSIGKLLNSSLVWLATPKVIFNFRLAKDTESVTWRPLTFPVPYCTLKPVSTAL
jgi:hypothetical protein